MSRSIKAAGLSVTNGNFKFHVTGRTGKIEQFVAIPGNTTYFFLEMPAGVTSKLQAAKYLRSHCNESSYNDFLDKSIKKFSAESAEPTPKVDKAARREKMVKVLNEKKTLTDTQAAAKKAAALEEIKKAAAKKS